MPATLEPTLKQRKYAKRYVENGGNGTRAALDSYDTDDYMTAAAISSQNLKKLKVKELIENQAEEAMIDQVEIRKELKESQTNYAVRSDVNKDILNRAGYQPPQKPLINIEGNVEFTWYQENNSDSLSSEEVGQDIPRERQEMEGAGLP